jgi:hypothetical protein
MRNVTINIKYLTKQIVFVGNNEATIAELGDVVVEKLQSVIKAAIDGVDVTIEHLAPVADEQE